MQFSEQWLREWVNPAVDTATLSHQLTMAGLEVDAAAPVAPAFEGIVVGHVLDVQPHPDADKLRVCQVDVGADGPVGIVCGAANVRAGMRVPTALVGAMLPGGLKIKAAKLRGVASNGMLCSAKELGLAEVSEGLMELPGDSPLGADVRQFLGLDDRCIELGLTPNRSDCLCIAGIAREVGVINRCPVEGPAMEPVAPTHDQTFAVELLAPVDCPRYVGRVVRGIDATRKTPLWMQERLRRSGVRSLGPVVDVTNYVMLELGQPMHGFDLRRLAGGIRVRGALAGESLTLLNGNELALTAGDLVIADHAGPLALAGIMGGEQSGVAADTRDVFLESAFFAPERLAGRARRYGLHTDSSHRFERGVDPQLQRRAIERATALLIAIAGGEAGPVVEIAAADQLPERAAVRLRESRLGRVLGMAVAAETVTDILLRLGMQVERVEGGWRVVPPSFRFDIAIEEDLIEEVARVVGYDQVPAHAPMAPLRMRAVSEAAVPVAALRTVLVERDYQEAVTYSFVEPGMQRLLDPEHPPIPLANPITADLAVMRTTLWAGLIPALNHNLNRQQTRVRLFETGLRFVRDADATRQEAMLAGVVYGPVDPEQWGTQARPADFFDVKGDVEALLGRCGQLAQVRFVSERHPALHPGQSARIYCGDRPIGWLGALHPTVQRELDVAGRVLVFELELGPISRTSLPKAAEISKFPTIRRDLAIVVARDVPAAAVLDCVRRAAPEWLRELKLFDVYAGERIDSLRKSVALGLTLQAQSRTLTDQEVEGIIGGVMAALGNEFGATLRE